MNCLRPSSKQKYSQVRAARRWGLFSSLIKKKVTYCGIRWMISNLGAMDSRPWTIYGSTATKFGLSCICTLICIVAQFRRYGSIFIPDRSFYFLHVIFVALRCLTDWLCFVWNSNLCIRGFFISILTYARRFSFILVGKGRPRRGASRRWLSSAMVVLGGVVGELTVGGEERLR